MYYARSKTRLVNIDGTNVQVDSNLEEKIIRQLEASGFKDRWVKPTIGLNVGKNNYTHDLELSVQFAGKTHRAIVEIKPAKSYFTNYISRRMRGVASHYYSDLLLLYTDDDKTWYRVDIKTGALSIFGIPEPGKILIRKLYKPVAIRAKGVYSHRYKRKPRIFANLLLLLANLLEALVTKPLGNPRKRRRRRQ